MKIELDHNLKKLAYTLRRNGAEIDAAKPEILRAIGVQLLSWGYQDYREKSEGRSSPDGVAWNPITDAALVTRMLKRKTSGYPANLDKRRALTRREQAIVQQQLVKKLPSGKGAAKARQRAAIAAQFYAAHPELQKIRASRRQLKAQRLALIAKERSSAKIGVDRGLLVNSLIFGNTNSIFDVGGSEVHVGAGMNYAVHFDRLRPIFGPNFVTADRVKSLDALVQKVLDRIAGKGL